MAFLRASTFKEHTVACSSNHIDCVPLQVHSQAFISWWVKWGRLNPSHRALWKLYGVLFLQFLVPST
jgi:hypothetical protein